ncbi:hypothetical protein CC80DRAFT_237977 [Byssothecium circinans]|uniref:Uncharacterized protein n=1 Tax=Byssothecium circinans TaxID=147558 RepID=A0A6A5U9S5_9PLEO|nr:hypothetical protein CC80DRAFT_237977 [Byssothecium circinans]
MSAQQNPLLRNLRPKPGKTAEQKERDRENQVARREKRKEASDNIDIVDILLPADQRKYVMTFESLNHDGHFKDLLKSEANYKPFLIMNFRPCIFGLYIQWLLYQDLDVPMDLSFPMRSDSASRVKQLSSDLIPAPAPSNAGPAPPSYATFSNTNGLDDVTIAHLTDVSADTNLQAASLARKYIHAHFMGQFFRARGFQDAVVNEIVRRFRADGPPTKELVSEVYTLTDPGLGCVGLKKLLVDYHVWCVDQRGVSPAVEGFDVRFAADVAATMQRVRLGGDVVVDFSSLVKALLFSNGAPSTRRCRYHLHSEQELCFALLVDKEPADTTGKPVKGRNA